MAVPRHLEKWPGVKQMLKMTRIREIKGKTTTEVAYGITSLSAKEANHLKIMDIWRGHWRIENNLHWVRDMVFHEDWSTIRKGSSPQIMAALRNLIIGLACKLRTTASQMRFYNSISQQNAISLIMEN
jgi:predicted transposase YbfD/YdcC